MSKVTVILTSFNHGKYIREAIDSVLNQTFTDYELIIWDDASSDDSWDIIRSYTDPRISSYRNEVNKQPLYGLNRAIFEIATGEYIAIHHSDDVWEPEKLEKQVAFLDGNTETGAVFTHVQVIDETGRHIENNWFDQENRTRWQWLHDLFLEKNHFSHPSILIRAGCYQEVGGYRFGVAQTCDAEMWSRLLMKYPVHILQEKLTLHRLFTDNSNTSSIRTDTRIRANNEWNILRVNYLALRDYDDLIKVFPSLERYQSASGFDVKFMLAMACLYECKCKSAWQLGLQWLFELLEDETSAEMLKRYYHFGFSDFIRLTGEFDVYDIGSENDALIEKLNRDKQWLEENKQSLEAEIEKRDAIFEAEIAKRDAIFEAEIAKRDAMLAEADAWVEQLNADKEILVANYEEISTRMENSTVWKLARFFHLVER